MSEETMTDIPIDAEVVTVVEPEPVIEAPPISISIEEYEAARDVIVEAGNDAPHDLDIVTLAVETQIAEQTDTILSDPNA